VPFRLRTHLIETNERGAAKATKDHRESTNALLAWSIATTRAAVKNDSSQIIARTSDLYVA
jgi:hypothetical protein